MSRLRLLATSVKASSELEKISATSVPLPIYSRNMTDVTLCDNRCGVGKMHLARSKLIRNIETRISIELHIV